MAEMGIELRPGDTVRMTDRYYEGEVNAGKIWKVRSWPWITCGEKVVLLEGFVGGYAVDGLELVERRSEVIFGK